MIRQSEWSFQHTSKAASERKHLHFGLQVRASPGAGRRAALHSRRRTDENDQVAAHEQHVNFPFVLLDHDLRCVGVLL